MKIRKLNLLSRLKSLLKPSLRLREEEEPTPSSPSVVDEVKISTTKGKEITNQEVLKVKMKLTSDDIEEFRRYAPIIFIPENERYVPVRMNFDGNWSMIDNPLNYDKLAERWRKEGLTSRDIYERYAVAYVNKLENVEVDGESFTVYQYWFYWPRNDFPLDWHDHDFEYVQVYVDREGKVRRVYTRYHLTDELKDYTGRSLNTSEKLKYHLMRELIPVMPTNSMKKGSASSEPLTLDTHPVVYLEPGGHGLVQDPKDSLMLFLNGFINGRQFKLAFMPSKFIPLLDPDNPDSPFPGGKDRRNLTDDKGNLRNRGFPYNWFMRTKAPIYRRSLWKGAHTLE